jgi:hypothetical protein
MTKIEIIDYVVKHYENNPRSVVDMDDGDEGITTSCRYDGGNGVVCAFSLCCTDEGRKKLIENISAIENLQSIGGCGGGEDILKPEFRGHYIPPQAPYYPLKGFWNDIQALHDRDDCWKEEGPWSRTRSLSAQGKEVVTELKAAYNKPALAIA